MAKKIQGSGLQELKASVQEGKIIVGREKVLQGLRKGNLRKIFLAKNCPDDVRGDVVYYAGLQNVSIEMMEATNEELGIICKKNFFVAVVGL